MGSNGIGDLNNFDFVSGGMYPGSQIDHSAYADPTQLPLAAQAVRADYDPETNPLTGEATSRFAKGGIAALHFDGTEGSQVEDTAPTEPAPPPTMSELADQLKLAYRTDTNYDDIWKQFAATKEQDPTQWYKHQLDFLGQQQGWQIGQNRSDRLAAFQPQVDDTVAQAKAAGISDKEIASILGMSSREGTSANKQRIATLAEMGGTGFNFQKDVQPGLVMLALATAAAMTGGAAAPALEGAEIGGAAAGSGAGDVFAGYSATGSAAGTAGSQLTASQIAALNATAAGGTTAGGITALGADAGGATVGAAGGDAVIGGSTASQLPSLSYTIPEIGGSYVAPGTVGAMNAALPAGATLGAEGTALGATIGGGTGAMSAAIPAGTVIGTGEGGTVLGATYLAGANGLPATTALGTPILASSVGTLGSEATAGGLTTKQLMAANMGMNALKSGFGGASGQGGTTGGQSTPTMQMPNQPYIAPTMLATPNYGKLYDAQIYNYNTRRAAQGGMMYGNGGGISTLGSYSDGGRLLKGPGDGMSDDIPAHIGEKQPAALADGEFVVPADVVSHLGNGSTDAGAKQLYKMMDRIREARTGQKRQGRQINPNKFLPKG
jgi:hypothetical protein